ncbi:cupin domain-containing protein [Paracoccus sp. MKU1]|uniref:cupin domain-containing protein n=1 Tax=Paracoccus sp. MKU1 TaxID=1745182 RepID=UPI000AFB157E|nr:cupin domain-containing protein [Paracoccus sp. MKU1]
MQEVDQAFEREYGTPDLSMPPNSHPGENEVFCILEGTYAFVIEGQEHIARAGDVVPIPNGAVHALKNIGEGPRRMFIFNVPGRIHAAFFAHLGEPMPRGARNFPPAADTPPDIPRLIEQARELGITLHH